MPLTEAQIAIRPRYLASSEVPIVLGVSPWGGAREVWEAKDTPSRKGVITERDAGHAASVGTHLEAGVLSWYEEHFDCDIVDRQTTAARFGRGGTPFSATCDGIVDDGWNMTLVEVKCVGRHMLPSWEDGPPAYVVAQVHVAAYVHGCDRAVVLMHSDGTSIQVFEVDVSDEAVTPTLEAAHRWWVRYVEGDTPPPETSDETLARAAGKPHAGEIEVAEGRAVELIELIGKVAEARRALEDQEKEIKAELALMLGDARRVKTPAGSAQWVSSSPATDWKAVASALGEITGPDALASAAAEHVTARKTYLQTYPKRSKT